MKLKIILLLFLVWGFIEGVRAGRASQFCTKTKFTHAFSSIVIASVPVVDALGMEACEECYGDLGMSYSEAKHRPQKPFLNIPRQAAVS